MNVPTSMTIAKIIALAMLIAACTQDKNVTSMNNNHGQAVEPTQLSHHFNGRTIDLFESDRAQQISKSSFDLVRSCRTQLKKSVSATDWQLARTSTYAIELRIAKDETISMENGSDATVSAMIISLEDNMPEQAVVLTLQNNHYRSPFIHCDPQVAERLVALVTQASKKMQAISVVE